MTDLDRYEAALHAVQTGVAMEHASGSNDGSPKHLRTAANSAMVTNAALASLLIAKGIFTEAEYVKALADEAEAEKTRYEDRLSAHFGKKVTLW